MTDLDADLRDMHTNLRNAQTDDCAMSLAMRITQIQFDRGELPISVMTPRFHRALARELMEEVRNEH